MSGLEDYVAAMRDRTPYDRGDGWVSLGAIERDRLIEHRHGVPWYEAPIPPRWHRCTPQTRGPMRFRHGPGSRIWGERNARRKDSRVRAA